METTIQSILGQNITLVYDSLDLRAIDGSKLKRVMGDTAMVMDTPDMIVAVFPPNPVIVQMGDRRTRVSLQQESKAIGAVPLWEIALSCHKLVPPDSQLCAYGFNYDALALMADADARAVIQDLFVSNLDAVESALGGHLLSFIPRLKFQRGGTVYDLILEPLDRQRIKTHINAHFEQGTLPSLGEFEASYRDEFEYLASTLPKLLGGGN